ncbi:Protein NAP1, partial [Mucuna pruriens]
MAYYSGITDKRLISIIHLAEQHISVDIIEGIREVLLSGAFSGLVSSLHLFEKPINQHTGSATNSIRHWYIGNIIKDVSSAGILFVPIHKCSRSTRPVDRYFAESVTDLKELQAFVHILVAIEIEREASMKQIVDLETVIGWLLTEASGAIFEEGAHLIHVLLAGVVKYLPDGVPRKRRNQGNEDSGKYCRCR